MPKNEILSYGELALYLELTSTLRRTMSEELRGQVPRGKQLEQAFTLIQKAEEQIRTEMREVRYDLLKKSWKPMTPETEMEKPETPEQKAFRKTQLETRPWQDDGPGPLDIREG